MWSSLRGSVYGPQYLLFSFYNESFWTFVIISLSKNLDFFLETCFLDVLRHWESKNAKKIPRSFAPVSCRILSFFLKKQFLFCKQNLIGYSGTLTWSYALWGFPIGLGKPFVKFPCPFFTVRFSILWRQMTDIEIFQKGLLNSFPRSTLRAFRTNLVEKL